MVNNYCRYLYNKDIKDNFIMFYDKLNTMKVTNCIKCGEYRYIENNGYCRDCLKKYNINQSFNQNTASCSENISHQYLLKQGYKIFKKLGYNVTLNVDNNIESPDGIAEPPKEFEEPNLKKLFGDKKLHIEAETTTLAKPSHMIHSVINAISENRHCVFLVKDGLNENKNFDYWANLGKKILENPVMSHYRNNKNNRVFYNTDKQIKLNNNSIPLIKEDPQDIFWSEYNESSEDISVQLKSSNNPEPLIQFEDSSELLNNPDPSKFPYHYTKDKQTEEIIVKNRTGEVMNRYKNIVRLKRENKYQQIKPPLIPELNIDADLNKQNWSFIIVSQTRKPMIYNDGELECLIPKTIESLR